MTRAQRDKGKRGEQEACILLRPLFPEVRTKRAGGESAVQDRGRDLLGTPGYCIQVKSMMRPHALRALNEAKRAAEPGEVPVALVRQCNPKHPDGEWVVTLSAAAFLALLDRVGHAE